ncbi:MAG: hypothetical protein A2268_11250 [Candidatus Raymondbacteria bacterium RifOxyA12_full_50_37]|uniref:CobQ/CobB/MinD/ParA nucleotide binding domain-containing protein n=1 Tax=Candidatus Raymondbacteria bacterium RIFOXYD12_FULL_49_13 TaxID=1817890 RepID=A0A1F7F7S3_UNCRA|nr:MAG: hypothetical protein A2268_11250 [Candidatus Raymondbacteria bacterium RifOxyA12_full_50_37]OGJ85583.1 MAG: hypothetical protein A2248_13035 [Candidatus Raymondbacteria bacterium RIFOXYA2_FULL_49_16]OGJ95086.1 MAG: hypothetical protein A2453_07735 [Candidatus Raymondbacteria bacterium RIFOXYC2_FULL_50_21]OGJ99472.1 MAG: hypothetical protein A2350_03825 [Candidatus Raymondbacteria bacterium RifOxyB12_full_50_8]OGK02602.1 MAG: hypothetical protein A2519_12395 [Candidatus Raymondbacteria b
MQTPSVDPSRSAGLPEIVRHYAELFRRKKWLLLIMCLIATGLAGYCIIAFDLLKHAQPATVLIGIDRPLVGNGTIGQESMGPKKIELIRSRALLQRVVADLSLCLRLEKGMREEFFDSIALGPTAVYGTYRVRWDPASKQALTVYLSKAPPVYRGEAVFRSDLSKSAILEIPGTFLRLNERFIRNPGTFTFSIVSTRRATDNILDNMTIEGPTSRKENYFTITLSGRDYALTTKIVNAIADLFVLQNLSFEKRRVHERIETLGKQLELARKQLATSDYALRDFLTANPASALDKQAERTLGSLVQQESRGLELESFLNDAATLQKEFALAPGEGRIDIVREILILLSSKNVIRASVLQSELSRLLLEKDALERTYSKGHPLVQANQQKIDGLALQASQALNDFYQDISRKVSEKKDNISQLSTRLRSLPQKGMQLAELQRVQQINSESYSMLMSRFNEAKVEDAVEVSDAFVMDYAVEPLPMPPMQKLLITLVLSLLAGLITSIAPIVFFDQYRRTAFSEIDLFKLIDIPILESIPVLRPAPQAQRTARERREAAGKPKPSPLLITEGVLPVYAKEVFRSLRTKILLSFLGINQRSILITSLDSGAGKTIVAANHGITLAQHGLKTLIVDSDLRRGTLHSVFGLKQSPGLSEYLGDNSEGPLPESIQHTAISGLDVMASGQLVSDVSELITPFRMGQFLTTAFLLYDAVVIDTPPLGVVADAAVIHEKFSKCMIVVKAGVTDINDLNEKLKEYPPIRNKIVGIVLNQARRDQRFKYYRSSPYIS